MSSVFLWLSLVTAAVGLLPGAAMAAEQTNDLVPIQEWHLKAIGGRAAINNIASLISYVGVTFQGTPGTMVITTASAMECHTVTHLGGETLRDGYDGDVGWTIDANGAARRMSAEELKPMINELFLGNYAYVIPGIMPGRTRRLSDTIIAGQAYYQLGLIPQGGDSTAVFINKNSGMIDYRAETLYGLLAVTTFSDYRPVAGVMMAHAYETVTPFGPYRVSARIDSVQVNRPVADSLFRLPEMIEDFAFPPKADSVVVRFHLVNDHIRVPAMINGAGPFTFILDSGAGRCVLTKRVVEKLNLAVIGELPVQGVGGYGSTGMTEIDSLSMNDMSLYIHHVSVWHPPASGADVLGDIDGVLGYDFFARFPVRIDFDRNRLVIYRPEKFAWPAGGIALEMEIFRGLPVIRGEIDGQPIRLGFDLGAQTGLVIRGNSGACRALTADSARSGRPVAIGGIGGLGTAREIPVKRLTLGAISIDNPPALAFGEVDGLPLPDYIEGLLGIGIIRDFDVLMDYRGGRLFLARRTPDD